MVNSADRVDLSVERFRDHVSIKSISVISSVITFVLALLIGVLMGFMQLLALNGFSESEGLPGLVAFALCQIAGLVLSVFTAAKLTALLIAKFKWAGFWASVTSIFAGTVLFVLLNVPMLFIPVAVIEILNGG